MVYKLVNKDSRQIIDSIVSLENLPQTDYYDTTEHLSITKIQDVKNLRLDIVINPSDTQCKLSSYTYRITKRKITRTDRRNFKEFKIIEIEEWNRIEKKISIGPGWACSALNMDKIDPYLFIDSVQKSGSKDIIQVDGIFFLIRSNKYEDTLDVPVLDMTINSSLFWFHNNFSNFEKFVRDKPQLQIEMTKNACYNNGYSSTWLCY
ncbi:MAG: hypothetical protein KDC92_07525 [Bacteroidetes bacterium]|nr:hypothetical protein [Bacteroidota bacterium]